MYDRYDGEFPKLSKVNSFASGGRIFYIKKVENIFVVYDYVTKLNIAVTVHDKEFIIDWIIKNIDKVKDRINECCINDKN